MPDLQAPAPLRQGHRVAVVATSSTAPRDRLASGVLRLKAWGLEPVLGQHVFDSHPRIPCLAGADEDRAADLVSAREAPAMRAIFCARGEGHCDPGAVEQLRTLPFGELGWSVLLQGLDTWAGGTATGPLVGGNVALLAASAGTGDTVPAAGAIAFLEDIGQPAFVLDRSLTQLLRTGWFDDVAGVLLGQFTMADAPAQVEAVLRERLAGLGVPVWAGGAFGPRRHQPGSAPRCHLGAGVWRAAPAVGSAAQSATSRTCCSTIVTAGRHGGFTTTTEHHVTVVQHRVRTGRHGRPNPRDRDGGEHPAHEGDGEQSSRPRQGPTGFLDPHPEHVRWTAVHVCSHAQT